MGRLNEGSANKCYYDGTTGGKGNTKNDKTKKDDTKLKPKNKKRKKIPQRGTPAFEQWKKTQAKDKKDTNLADMYKEYQSYNPPTTIGGIGTGNNSTEATIVSGLVSLDDISKRTAGKFNPPPHKSSRSIAPIAFPNYTLSKEANADTVRTLQSAYRRGFIYQDIDNAFDAKGKAKAKKDLWGFQFMYNPSQISYSNSQNTNVDWSNTQDVSNLLIGTQSITFSLFLNRVVDMSALSNSIYKSGTNKNGKAKFATVKDITSYYGRQLSVSEVHGILDRGTDYDLEFLYRVLNGEPELGPTTNSATSDFGYISGLPVWLNVHKNLRYKGVVNAINVNHVMFTENMIPMITEVQLSFTRIPAPLYTTDSNAWYDTRYNGTVPKYSVTPTTTDTPTQ